MKIQSDTMYRCTIAWHAQPEATEEVLIYAGDFPKHLYHTDIDAKLFFAMPVDQLAAGYDEGDWTIVVIHEPVWHPSNLPIHRHALHYLQTLICH
ncbi:MAG: hypothetical protein ACO3F2_01420 [Roseiflexaceae bacterium]